MRHSEKIVVGLLFLCFAIKLISTEKIENWNRYQTLKSYNVILQKKDNNKFANCCSGSVIGHTAKNSFVLTCKHCVEGAKNDGSDVYVNKKKTEIFLNHKYQDLVILKTGKLRGDSYATIALQNVRVSEEVFMVGNPVGFEHVYSKGYFAGTERVHSLFDIMASPGSSGSGIYNDKEQLIGVLKGYHGNTFIGLDYYVLKDFLQEFYEKAK